MKPYREVPAISKHLKNIYAEGELSENTTISKMETVVNRGFRGEVPEKIDFYNLDTVLNRTVRYGLLIFTFVAYYGYMSSFVLPYNLSYTL